jgi:hypothetical protein
VQQVNKCFMVLLCHTGSLSALGEALVHTIKHCQGKTNGICNKLDVGHWL